jgi:small subunit ribosomal protein S17
MTETTQKKKTIKEFTGEVLSDKMDKTRVVRVSRRVRHPRYGKVLTRSKKFYAHDAENKSHTGDVVRIVESRPLSRLKRWTIVEVVQQAQKPEKLEA